MLRNGMLRL